MTEVNDLHRSEAAKLAETAIANLLIAKPAPTIRDYVGFICVEVSRALAERDNRINELESKNADREQRLKNLSGELMRTGVNAAQYRRR